MAGKMNSKVRLVKCPTCLQVQVLPESPDVPVYTCGGCCTRLQAKKRNKSTVDATSQRPFLRENIQFQDCDSNIVVKDNPTEAKRFPLAVNGGSKAVAVNVGGCQRPAARVPP